MKSYDRRIWWWYACALVLLLCFRYLPEFKFAGITFRKVDFLAEILRQNDTFIKMPASESTELASTFQPAEDTIPSQRQWRTLPLPHGLQNPIENFATDSAGGAPMNLFYQSLRQLQDGDGEQPRKVRIAFFGDSFIEGDILTDHFRDTLQQLYGGAGVGFVPIASPMNRSRTSITEQFSGFSYFSAVDTGATRKQAFSISGQFSIPTAENNSVSYTRHRQHERLQKFDKVRLLYQTNRNATFTWSAGVSSNRQYHSVQLSKAPILGSVELSLDSPIHRLNLHFPQDSLLRLHGISFESGAGIYVDNFALRGSSGHPLFRVPMEQFLQADTLLRYDLIILQYGLNVLSPGQIDYEHYAPTLRRVIQRVKEGFPQAAILVVGVGDRAQRKDGQYITLEGLHHLKEVQRRISLEEGVAFWDLHQAMGGDQSMVRLVHHEPSYANKDYTHINRRGGKLLAGYLAKALLHGAAEFNHNRDL